MLAVVLLFSLFASAERPLSLREIDALIDKNEYNTALEQLTQYMRAHPEAFESAQKRVHRIMTERLRFNADAQRLVDKMEHTGDDEGDAGQNDVEKVELIEALERSEVNRADESVSLTNDARRAITLRYYIMRADEILREGTALVERGSEDAHYYAQAARKFMECFSLKKSTTDVVYRGDMAIPVNYAASVTGAVEHADTAIAGWVSQLPALLDACESAVESLLAAVAAEDASLSARRFSQVEAAFKALADCRNGILSQAKVLRETDNEVLRLHPALGTSYIAFSRVGVDGTDASPDGGILSAVDAFWNTRTERMKAAVYAATVSTLDAIVPQLPLAALFSAADCGAARLALDGAATFADLGVRAHSLYALLDDCVPASFTEYVASMTFARSLCRTQFRVANDNVAQISSRNVVATVDDLSPQCQQQVRADIDFYEETMVQAVEAQKDVFLRTELAREEAAQTLDAGDATDMSVRTMPGVQVTDDVLRFDSALALYPAVLETIEVECRRRLVQTWTALAMAYDDDAHERLDGFRERLTKARRLAGTDAGEVPTLASDDGGLSVERYYPTQAAALFVALKVDIGAGKEMLSGYRAVLLGGESYRSERAEFDSAITGLEDVIATLSGLLSVCEEGHAAAITRAARSRLAAQEAESLYQRSQSALAEDRFDEARELLSRARARYSDALFLEDNEELRAGSDRRLVALDASISDQQQRVIVVQTRELKTRARTAYYAADFESASRDLARARDLWAVTNGDSEDQEITDLLAMINTALSMRTGRYIPVTAPLYPEMSQILSQANQLYGEGEALLGQGRRQEARTALSRAQEQLRKVQLVYPLHQEASLLSLRIERLLDPKAFERSFARRVEAAKANTNRQEAYAVLTDLREINPAYQGLSELILNIEYETGIRRRPIDRTTRSAAASRLAQAERVYTSAKGNSAELDKAVALLNEAISLNPDDSAATSLKDKIQIEAGARATSILSAADEAAYLVAIQELNKNNVITANAMVEQLMRKGDNSRNKKLQLLQKRIKALL